MEKIISKSNPKIKTAAKLVNSASFRKETGLFCIEGIRLCQDAVLSGVKIKQSFFSSNLLGKNPEAVSEIENHSSQCYEVTQEIFEKISDTGSPQGVLCVCEKGNNVSHEAGIDNSGKYILLENVQDPSNLGTICRSAEALGIDAVILCGCCDLYSPKVLRGSMGAIFRLNIVLTDDACEFLEECEKNGIKTYAAVPDKNAGKITDINFDGGCVCVIGNEGNGISKEVINACTESVTIRMLGKAESLNASVAACIVMWEMLR